MLSHITHSNNVRFFDCVFFFSFSLLLSAAVRFVVVVVGVIRAICRIVMTVDSVLRFLSSTLSIVFAIDLAERDALAHEIVKTPYSKYYLLPYH